MGRTCRDEVQEAFIALSNRSGALEFALGDIVRFMRETGSSYPEPTIRTHIVHHMMRTPERPTGELERVSRGTYRLADPSDEILRPATGSRRRERHAPIDREERIRDVISNFPRYCQRFQSNLSFTGPSVYFHRKAVARVRNLGVAAALRDELFFDYMVATLTSWGMHRMGNTKTKIGDIHAIRASFSALAPDFERLSGLKLAELDESEASHVADLVWPLLKELSVGIGETKLVVNSKALHHLLPDLIPPIDRRYTVWFLTNSTQIPYSKEASLFSLVLSTYAGIAHGCGDLITEMQDDRDDTMNSSPSKIIDNALVGYRLVVESSARKVVPRGDDR